VSKVEVLHAGFLVSVQGACSIPCNILKIVWIESVLALFVGLFRMAAHFGKKDQNWRLSSALLQNLALPHNLRIIRDEG
jgi:hypothetical protein